MAPREDVITSAVTFLQDPSVASAPLEKRIEFLKSKNLTQEEIDLSLARASGPDPSSQPAQNGYYPPPAQQVPRGPPSQRYPYPYNPYGDQWAQPHAPPEPPRRDWRDWFIMATVVSGASYGLYVLAQRYIKPLIAPPTPEQIEQDKASIDEQFNKAFALLDTLSSDTAALKEAEEQRTQRLDNAITDIETIVADLKAANMRREDDARRMETEIRTMKDSLPRSIENVRDASEKQLKELSTELGSLKVLMGNRLGSGSNSLTQNIPRTQPGVLPTSNNAASSSSSAETPGIASGTYPRPGPKVPNAGNPYADASAPPPASTGRPLSAAAFQAALTQSTKDNATKAAIPAWQMAAANKAKEASAGLPTTNGTSGNTQQQQQPQQQEDGADAVAALNAS
ncbi:peroxisomal membrane protein pex14 [Rhinocladiella similis]